MAALLELEDLPVERWPQLVRELQKQHVHHHVSIEEQEPGLEEDDIATWCVVDSGHLLGLSYATLPCPAIEVAWRTPAGRTRFHRSADIARLRHARDAAGREIDLRIDRRDGGSTLLHFMR